MEKGIIRLRLAPFHKHFEEHNRETRVVAWIFKSQEETTAQSGVNDTWFIFQFMLHDSKPFYEISFWRGKKTYFCQIVNATL